MPPPRVHVVGEVALVATSCCQRWFGTLKGHNVTDVKVLPLTSYDSILGMDWLENKNNGKMWIKTMRLKHEGTRITLRGIQTNLDSCTAISATSFQGLISTGEVCRVLELFNASDKTTWVDSTVPPEVQILLQRCTPLFDDPHSLPLHRKYDHHIPPIFRYRTS
jgi:hypothetical protein